MEVTKACQYAVRGLVYLAARKDLLNWPVMLAVVADATAVPEPYLSKVFQALKAAGILQSHRGRVRGYSLAKEPRLISLYDVFLAMEGRARLHACEGSCGERSFAQVWLKVEASVAGQLRSVSLANLV